MSGGTHAIAELARAERTELVALLRTLTPEQWCAPSLCSGWTVRDVVAHLASYDAVRPRDAARRFVTSRFVLSDANDRGLDDLAMRSDADLVDALDAADGARGLPAALGWRVVLVDTLVHHQDIRRPLGLRREIPAARLRSALNIAVVAPPLRGFWRVRGVRVVATDIEWSFGCGPEARGPGEAVLMALAGRPGAAHDLEGPGAPALVRRLGSPRQGS